MKTVNVFFLKLILLGTIVSTRQHMCPETPSIKEYHLSVEINKVFQLRCSGGTVVEERNNVGVCCTDRGCTNGTIRNPPPDIEILSSVRSPSKENIIVEQDIRVTNPNISEIMLGCCHINHENQTCVQYKLVHIQILNNPRDHDPEGTAENNSTAKPVETRSPTDRTTALVLSSAKSLSNSPTLIGFLQVVILRLSQVA